MNRKLSTLVLLAAVLMCGGLARNASAVSTWDIILIVPANTTPDNVSVLFGGTGGITSVVGKSVEISSIGFTGSTVNTTLQHKYTQGVQIRYHFTQNNNTAPVLGGGSWKNGNNVLVGVQAADIRIQPKSNPVATPGVSSIGLILLSLLTLGTGIYILGRRRTATA